MLPFNVKFPLEGESGEREGRKSGKEGKSEKIGKKRKGKGGALPWMPFRYIVSELHPDQLFKYFIILNTHSVVFDVLVTTRSYSLSEMTDKILVCHFWQGIRTHSIVHTRRKYQIYIARLFISLPPCRYIITVSKMAHCRIIVAKMALWSLWRSLKIDYFWLRIFIYSKGILNFCY